MPNCDKRSSSNIQGNCWKSGNKQRISLLHFNWRFIHVESVSQIHSQAADGTTEGALCGNCPGHAGLCKQQHRIYKNYHNWWWDLSLWLQSRKQVSIFTIEASKSPKPKKARQVCSNVKVMLTCFFDSHGIVHHECAPKGQTINKEVLHCLCDAV